MFKGKHKSLDEDEETVRPKNDSVEIWFSRPQGLEMPNCSHQTELDSGEGLQISTGILISDQVI